MKLAKLVSASALSLLLGTFVLGTTALTYAQDQRDEAKPPPEARPEDTKPEQEEMKSPRQDEAKPQKPDEEKDKPAHGDDKAIKQETRNPPSRQNTPGNQATARNEPRTLTAFIFRTTSSAHISDANIDLPSTVTVVNGQPRFQYGGFWFTVVDTWPAGWVRQRRILHR